MDQYDLARQAVSGLYAEIMGIDHEQIDRPDVQEWLGSVYAAVAALRSVYTLRDVEVEANT